MEILGQTFQIIEDAWRLPGAQQLPIAIVWGVAPSDRPQVAEYFSGSYRLAFCYGKTPWRKQRKALATLNEPVFLVCDRKIPWRAKRYVAVRHISQHHFSIEEIPKKIGAFFIMPTAGWKQGQPERPVAVVFGVPKLLRARVTARLPQYSLLFMRETTELTWSDAQKHLEAFIDLHFVAWEGHWPPEALEYLKERGGEVYYLKPGWPHSAASPSLDPESPAAFMFYRSSHCEMSPDEALAVLYSQLDFEEKADLVNDAEKLIVIARELEISQYCPPCALKFEVQGALLNYRGRRRVLVIGEDASETSADADASSGFQLLKLAVEENPGAEIFYFPSPRQMTEATASGYGEYTALATIIDDYGVLPRLLEKVDRVYVESSPLGLEALWHGRRVTVTGRPFYAGWGLTDDRSALTGRSRRLTLPQLFAASYLLFQIFDPSPGEQGEASVVGLLTALFRLYYEKTDEAEKRLTPDFVKRNSQFIGLSKYWPVLLREQNFRALHKKGVKAFLEAFPLRYVFSSCGGDLCQLALACLLLGALPHRQYFERLLKALRGLLPADVYEKLMELLSGSADKAELFPHKLWIYIKNLKFAEAAKLLDPAPVASGWRGRRFFSIATWGRIKFFSVWGRRKCFADPRQALWMGNLQLAAHNLDAASDIYLKLLLDNRRPAFLQILRSLTSVARDTFDFSSLCALHDLAYYYNTNSRNARGDYQSSAYLIVGDTPMVLKTFIMYNAHRIGALTEHPINNMLRKTYGDLPYGKALLNLAVAVGTCSHLDIAKAFLDIDNPEEAERYLVAYTPKVSERPLHVSLLAKTKRLTWNISQAKRLLTEALEQYPREKFLYIESLENIRKAHDMPWADELAAFWERYWSEDGNSATGYTLLQLWRRRFNKSAAARCSIYAVYRPYLRSFFPNKLIFTFEEALAQKAKSILVFKSDHGPGDEIRLYPFYRNVTRKLDVLGIRVTFTCNAKLHSLLARSFPDLTFVPTAGIRYPEEISDFSKFTSLPSLGLCSYFSNESLAAVKTHDVIIDAYNAIESALHCEDDKRFSEIGQAVLIGDDTLVERWRERLAPMADQNMLVGLCWRSSLVHYNRKTCYVDAASLSPLLRLDGVRFINLQYDECSRELALLERLHPGKMINFPEIDQYNDFETVAALMSNLDLIISSGTTVAEVAGALGRPTLLMTPSRDEHYRHIPGTQTDMYWHSVTHVCAEYLGDVDSLMANLRQQLLIFLDSGEWKARRNG